MGSKKRKKKSDEVVDVAPKIKAPAGTDDSARVVLVIGGEGHDNKRKIVSHKSTELLNLGTLTFSQGPSTTRGRQRFSVARLGKSMRALVVGGIGSGALNSTEVVDLDTLTCIKGPNLKSKRQLSAAVLLDEESGRVIVFGGSGEEALSSTEIFDPEANQFTPGPEMARRRTDVTAVMISENRILVIGGSNIEDGGALATTELLDLNTMRFASGPDMTMPRQGATAVALSGERVLVIGGIGPDQECSNTTEFIDVATGTSS